MIGGGSKFVSGIGRGPRERILVDAGQFSGEGGGG